MFGTAPLKRTAKIMVSNIDKKAVDGERTVRLCNYVDVYRNDQITDDLPFMEATASNVQIARLTLRAGDVLITKDSETPEDIAASAYVPKDLPGVVCGYHLAILRPNGPDVEGKYLHWAISSAVVRGQFHASAFGITRFGLRQSAIGKIEVPMPRAAQQRSIARYLDRETARIDALVEKKRRLGRLLQIRAGRHRDDLLAPSANFDPVRLKLSGLPDGWTVSPLMHLTDTHRPIVYGIVQAGPDYPEGGVPYIKTGDLLNLDVANLSTTSPEIDGQYARARVRPGDVVIAMRASIGLAVLVPAELLSANLTQGTARVAAGPGIDPLWLFQVIQCHVVQEQCVARAVSATFKTLNIWDLRRIKIPIPPQHEIAGLTSAVTAEIDRATAVSARLQRQVSLLLDRRQTLITAAVSGQVEFPEAV